MHAYNGEEFHRYGKHIHAVYSLIWGTPTTGKYSKFTAYTSMRLLHSYGAHSKEQIHARMCKGIRYKVRVYTQSCFGRFTCNMISPDGFNISLSQTQKNMPVRTCLHSQEFHTQRHACANTIRKVKAPMNREWGVFTSCFTHEHKHKHNHKHNHNHQYNRKQAQRQRQTRAQKGPS